MDIRADVQLGIDFIQRFAPMAEKLGIPILSTAAMVAEVTADTAEAALKAADAGQQALSTDDVTALQAMYETAKQHRRDLAAQIAAS